MTQHLTERDVRDIATYARIGLTDDELVQMTTDLNSIIDTLKPITEFDLEGVDDSLVPADSIEFDKDEVKKTPSAKASRRKLHLRTHPSSKTAASSSRPS